MLTLNPKGKQIHLHRGWNLHLYSQNPMHQEPAVQISVLLLQASIDELASMQNLVEGAVLSSAVHPHAVDGSVLRGLLESAASAAPHLNPPSRNPPGPGSPGAAGASTRIPQPAAPSVAQRSAAAGSFGERVLVDGGGALPRDGTGGVSAEGVAAGGLTGGLGGSQRRPLQELAGNVFSPLAEEPWSGSGSCCQEASGLEPREERVFASETIPAAATAGAVDIIALIQVGWLGLMRV